MYKKIIKQFFPDEIIKNEISPVNFHIKMIIPEIYYFMVIKRITDNRRVS